MDYTVVRASDEDQVKIDDFIHDHFLPEMPLIPMFGVESMPPRPGSNTPLSQTRDIHLKAVDRTGELIGVAINRVNVQFALSAETPPQVKQMVEFLHFVEERAEMHKLPENMIELRILSVRQDWRNRGVARKLAEESMKAAREAGFKAMKVCCTSEFTAKLARRLGWREHYRLAYKDYPRLSGTDICLKPTPPHEYVYYYVTDL